MIEDFSLCDVVMDFLSFRQADYDFAVLMNSWGVGLGGSSQFRTDALPTVGQTDSSQYNRCVQIRLEISVTVVYYHLLTLAYLSSFPS